MDTIRGAFEVDEKLHSYNYIHARLVNIPVSHRLVHVNLKATTLGSLSILSSYVGHIEHGQYPSSKIMGFQWFGLTLTNEIPRATSYMTQVSMGHGIAKWNKSHYYLCTVLW